MITTLRLGKAFLGGTAGVARGRQIPATSVAVVVVAVHLVLLFIVIPRLSDGLRPYYNQNGYADGYDQLAANLAGGNGYRFYPDTARTLLREPGYPMFLAGIFLVFGSGLPVVKGMNVLAVFLTAWLMTRIGRRVSKNAVLINLPPLLFLFHPGTLIAESRGGVEALLVLLLTLFVLTLYRAIEKMSRRDFLISGGVLGLTVLVRSTLVLFPIILLAYLLAGQGRDRRSTTCANVAWMIAAMLVVLSPWIIRNYLVTRRFVPTASVLGVSAQSGQYICEHLSRDRRWVDLDREAANERVSLAKQLGYRFKDGFGYYQSFYSSDEELRFSAYLLTRVIGHYRTSPALFVKCASFNLFNFWFAGKTVAATTLNLIVQLPYLILAIIGATLAVKRTRFTVVGPLVIFIIYYVAVYVPILAQARYSVPLIPFVSILASLTVAAVAERCGWSKWHGETRPSNPCCE